MPEEIVNFEIAEAPSEHKEKWVTIPLDSLTTENERKTVHRLNALGSMFYFSKVVLRNHRLADIHLDMCENIERENLKEVIEEPRDHFKSTIHSESAPIWWALPFTKRDEDLMKALGYSDEWIRWMKIAHNQDTRTLLVSENITNAAKLGVRIDGHYTNNDFFKYLFSEVIPSSASSWTQFSKTHKRSAKSKPHGEGTFDYLGVGAALQSRHYDRVVQDDLVGKAAVESDSVMQKTIEYHKLLVGAFDSVPGKELDNDEIVVGNRWSWKDLNSYIRAEETYFRITNHSALGGCCSKHPAGKPIFPEEFTVQKLERFSKRLGPYLFSCQFLNKPIPPKDTPFDVKYLRYYTWGKEKEGDPRSRTTIRHEVSEGEVIPDLPCSNLQIIMICDPNHAGDKGRCNHAIVVLGVDKDKNRVEVVDGNRVMKRVDYIYLLDTWAESASYDALVANIYRLSDKWRLREFWLETIAAQKYLKYHLDYRNRIEGRRLKINELKTSRAPNAKDDRILATGPWFENRQFFCKRSDVKFIEEFSLYPNGATRDTLDVIGYGSELLSKTGWSSSEVKKFYDFHTPTVGSGPCGY